MARPGPLKTFRSMRGKRVIECPETHRPAAVKVDALHAAAGALLGHPELRLADCSRWPEKAGCGQECLSQISERPEDCLVKTLVTRWYAGKACALCGKPAWSTAPERKPALLSPANTTVSWCDVAPEDLPDVLANYRPVCWDCHVVETVERLHPGTWFTRPPRKPTLQ
jgi:hypothetical protein